MAADIKCEFTLHMGEKTEIVTDVDLIRYADEIGLNRVANGRCSFVFLMDVILHERFLGLEARAVVEEIRALEKGRSGVGTKPASKFRHAPLRGFWHKHYFSARFAPKNMLDELDRVGMEAVIREKLEAIQLRGATGDVANELSRTLTVEQIQQREDAGRLTGEWIVFAKYSGENYYLCLATHEMGNPAIFDRIRASFPQFPFLSKGTPIQP